MNNEHIKLGFIILRHISSELTEKYWYKCYESIRLYYPENPILIIDDNSVRQYITSSNYVLYNTTVVNSEYPSRGELLPYIYYLRYPFAQRMVILHDSVFINNGSIPWNSVTTYRSLWSFEHYWDQIEDETYIIKNAFKDDSDLLKFHSEKHRWKGCFGAMSVISYEYLNKINSKYNLLNLVPYITSRHNRCSFERIIACIMQKEDETTNKNESFFGIIHTYCPWGMTFNDIEKYRHLPLIKVWSGR